jgi:hypothetical protein
MQTFFQEQNIFLNELQRKKDIECYDQVMESCPNYQKMWCNNLFLAFKQKAREYFKS